MKRVTQGVRVFVSKRELKKLCSLYTDEFGDTEQTAHYILTNSNGELYVSISPRCAVPMSACKPI